MQPLIESKQAFLIPWLVYDLNRDELAITGQRRSEFLGPPKSVFAAEAILKIVEESSAFQPEVREWARNLPKPLKSADYEGQRAAVRKWWKENQRYFIDANYQAVRPLSHLP